ncbi:MAG: hypothetical protein OXN95_10445 [bacterium]|nr:hypothetical protein [bacterium]
MRVIYSDAEITALIAEPKYFPGSGASLQLRQKRGHSEQHVELESDSGADFALVLRQNSQNQFDFSIILTVRPIGTASLFRLRRFNGRSHKHRNTIEGDVFFDFHIHTATERYQRIGAREDAYAEPTTQFASFQSAWQFAVADVNINSRASGPTLPFP